MSLLVYCIFFVRQKAAYEMRISDWSSDVCSSDLGSTLVLPCDVADAPSLDATFATLRDAWGRLDFLVHAIAHSDKEELKGRYLDTSRENFLHTLDISCYSFTAVARRAVPLMTAGGSMVTLTYSGSERVMPNYNVMGVAKAALEASVRYLASDLRSEEHPSELQSLI